MKKYNLAVWENLFETSIKIIVISLISGLKKEVHNLFAQNKCAVFKNLLQGIKNSGIVLTVIRVTVEQSLHLPQN